MLKEVVQAEEKWYQKETGNFRNDGRRTEMEYI